MEAEEEQQTKTSKKVRFSETVSVRVHDSSKEQRKRPKINHNKPNHKDSNPQKPSPLQPPTTSKKPVNAPDVLEDDELANKAKEARREKRKHNVEGFEEDDSDEDIAFEAMGETETTPQEGSDGVPMEAFNVREELDDGVIDPLSGVVNPRKSRDNDIKDEHWLLDFEEKMKDKRYAARFNTSKKSFINSTSEDSEVTGEPIDKNTLLNEIANELLWGETVNGAMRRIRPKKSTSEDTRENKIKFNSFLEKVDKAVSVGVSSIYSMSKEEILDLLDTMEKKSILWEYKWSRDDIVYGPMSNESMLEWLQQGYFVDSPEFGPVLVRKVPTEEFVDISSVDFTQ